MAHTRELAYQISKDYERFSKYTPNLKVAVFFGGLPIQRDQDVLKRTCPHVVVGTPGRLLALARSKVLRLSSVRHFVLDECDKMLENLGKCFFYKRGDGGGGGGEGGGRARGDKAQCSVHINILGSASEHQITLARSKVLCLSSVKHFVLGMCDEMLEILASIFEKGIGEVETIHRLMYM